MRAPLLTTLSNFRGRPSRSCRVGNHSAGTQGAAFASAVDLGSNLGRSGGPTLRPPRKLASGLENNTEVSPVGHSSAGIFC
jgi:hypothetical protein